MDFSWVVSFQRSIAGIGNQEFKVQVVHSTLDATILMGRRSQQRQNQLQMQNYCSRNVHNAKSWSIVRRNDKLLRYPLFLGLPKLCRFTQNVLFRRHSSCFLFTRQHSSLHQPATSQWWINNRMTSFSLHIKSMHLQIKSNRVTVHAWTTPYFLSCLNNDKSDWCEKRPPMNFKMHRYRETSSC